LNQILITGIVTENMDNISKSEIVVPMLEVEAACPLPDGISFFSIPAVLADRDSYRYLYVPRGSIVLLVGDLLHDGEKFFVSVKQMFTLIRNAGKHWSLPKTRALMMQNENFTNRVFISGELSEDKKSITVDALPPRGQLAVSNRLPLALPESTGTCTMSLCGDGLIHIGELC
jgi:hypothetical protein